MNPIESKAGPEAETSPFLTAADPLRGLIVPMVLLLSIAVVVIIAISWFAAERLDHETENRDVALARTALATEAERLGFLAKDLSYWDEAIERLVIAGDLDWADANVGSYAYENSRVNLVIVMSVLGKTRLLFKDGQIYDGKVQDFLAPAMLDFLTRTANAAPMGEPEPVVRYAVIGGQVHTIAASAFTPELDSDGPLKRSPRPILIIASVMDEGFLAGIADAFLLEDLAVSLALPDAARVYAPISARDEWATAYLTWNPSRPGTRLRQDLLIPVVVSLLAIALLGLLYTRRLARARREAEAISMALERERELRDLKSRFISTVSHEMRTPLATIQAATDLLDHFGNRMTAEERQKEMDTIRGRVAAIDDLLGEALLLEKGETRQPAPEDIDLPAMIRAHWQNNLPSEGRALELVDERPVAATVRFDRRTLSQIIGNLLQNALKYSAADSTVAVRILEEDDRLVITVTDHGIGIPQKDLAHVREPFSRGGNVADVGGVGFGLSIVDRAIALLGGSLNLVSTEGEGTIVTVSLPLPVNRELSR
ncbi:MAG: ATP-binding protein [Minwuia sp.]|nr:ATP-binding protein [Minwuia sp.]